MSFRFAPAHGPAVAGAAMIATSQVPATLAGLDILRAGGNAVDAALAAAAVLCVAEPMSTGIGGDAFAIVWDGERLHGLDAAGAAPGSAAPLPVHTLGPRSVNAPGAVAGWAALSARFGRLGLDTCLTPAIDLAEAGAVAGANCALSWSLSPQAPAEFGPPPRVGDRFHLPGLAGTLRAIADRGPAAMSAGPVADANIAASWLQPADLTVEARWIEPLQARYRGVGVAELPPPTQGVAALLGLRLLERMAPSLPSEVRAVALALGEARVRVRDGADVTDLLTDAAVDALLRREPVLMREPPGGTVYLCCVDGDGMAVSFIQSLFEPFGSGVVAPGTGVVLSNRAACFAVNGAIEPGRRPYHTIIPGMLLDSGGVPLGPFGVMGGFIQAQAHVQLVSALVDDELDPQAALDRARFRLDDGVVRLEQGLWDRAAELEGSGLRVVCDRERLPFGGGQVILRAGDRLLGGSDARKDGLAAGW